MKVHRNINSLVIALLLGETCLHAAEPTELTTLRAQRDKEVAKIQQEAESSEKRLNEQYLRYLDSLMQRFTRAGDLDAALAVRKEKQRILGLLGQEEDLPPTKPSSPATAASLVKTPMGKIAVIRGEDKEGTLIGSVAAGTRIIIQYESGKWTHANSANFPVISPDDIPPTRPYGEQERVVILAAESKRDNPLVLASIPNGTAEHPFEFTFSEPHKLVTLRMSGGDPAGRAGKVQYRYSLLPNPK